MDKALKQRLVGATVLIALAVIVLPMIFGGRPSPGGPETRSIELPAAPPDLDFETRRFPVGDEQGLGGVTGRIPGADRAADAGDAAPASTLPEPDESSLDAASEAAETGQAEAPTGAPADAVDAPAGEEGATAGEAAAERMDVLVAGLMDSEGADSDLRYVVQVASFGNAGNASRLASELEEAGYPVLLDNVTSDTGRLDRVRVGPYASEAEAREVTEALSEHFSGVKPRIVDTQPEEAGPALASDDPLMRWIVQVGSFSSQVNARDLVSRLRASGLSAFDETVRTDTSTIYRVRVGPYLDRAQALEAEQKIAAEMGIDGVVMSSD